MNSIPIISVVMITYAHEKYIQEAIEGVFLQQFNGSIELIIANDNSPDDTHRVVTEFLNNSTIPSNVLIKYTKHESNLGMMPNFIWALQQANGKYIALCEGDDYWTDPLKLQKQVGFLEVNPSYYFSMGKVNRLIEKDKSILSIKEHVNPSIKDTYSLKDYIKFPFSQTSSFLFRNNNFKFPSWFSNVFAGDQSLVVIITGLDGKIKYHDELFSIYRVHSESISHVNDPMIIINKSEYFLKNINFHTKYEFNRIIIIRKYINKLQFYKNSKNFVIKFCSKLAIIVLTKFVLLKY
jgi:glycosyltransferase involved in cell wall biosynthesis